MLPIIEAVENMAASTVQNPLPDEVLINAIAATAKPKVSKRSLDLLYLQSLKFMDR